MFIFILLSAFWAWHVTENKIHYIRNIRDMEVVAKNSMHNLVTTRGNPINWDELDIDNFNTTATFGFVEQDYGIASSEKIDRLIYLGNNRYNETKNILGIIGPGYEFYLNVGDNSTGLEYVDPDIVIVVNRAMLLENGSRININMRIWK